MSKRLFSTDPFTGITTYWSMDPQTGKVTIQKEQKMQPIADANKRASNETGNAKFGDIARVASIPLSVYYDLKRRGIADDPVALKKWLNDGDNSVFRTRGGTL